MEGKRNGGGKRIQFLLLLYFWRSLIIFLLILLRFIISFLDRYLRLWIATSFESIQLNNIILDWDVTLKPFFFFCFVLLCFEVRLFVCRFVCLLICLFCLSIYLSTFPLFVYSYVHMFIYLVDSVAGLIVGNETRVVQVLNIYLICDLFNT